MKNVYLPILFAVLTGLFWGLYGPALGLSRGVEKNAFKPYLAIGLAYLVWGVLGGVVGVGLTRGFSASAFSFSGQGITWGFIAGTLGAWGAFTLTLAMFTGGAARPHIVMPIVFGGAVTVSAIVSMIQTGATRNPLLWIGIIGIGVGIILVASNTPHGAPHSKKHEEPKAAQHEEAIQRLQAGLENDEAQMTNDERIMKHN